MIKYLGIKVNANEYAKMLVQNKGDGANYWEDFNDDLKDMTNKEIEEIEDAINKHQQRVWDFLGCSKIHNKTR